MENKLPITEELDFAYLLTLLPPLFNEPKFAWLPELFSIVGYERLLTLCKYCGNELIRIPTLDELSDSIDALQFFYDLYIKRTKSMEDVPAQLAPLVCRIAEVYKESDNGKYYKGDSELRKVSE